MIKSLRFVWVCHYIGYVWLRYFFFSLWLALNCSSFCWWKSRRFMIRYFLIQPKPSAKFRLSVGLVPRELDGSCSMKAQAPWSLFVLSGSIFLGIRRSIIINIRATLHHIIAFMASFKVTPRLILLGLQRERNLDPTFQWRFVAQLDPFGGKMLLLAFIKSPEISRLAFFIVVLTIKRGSWWLLRLQYGPKELEKEDFMHETLLFLGSIVGTTVWRVLSFTSRPSAFSGPSFTIDMVALSRWA